MKKTFETLSFAFGIVLVIGLLIMPVMILIRNQGARQEQQEQLQGFQTASASQIATSSTIVVGPQQVKNIFNANPGCLTRLFSIPPGGSPVMLSFFATAIATITPTSAVGNLYAGSSTYAFPAEIYGCGPVAAYAGASTTITRSEFSQ